MNVNIARLDDRESVYVIRRRLMAPAILRHAIILNNSHCAHVLWLSSDKHKEYDMLYKTFSIIIWVLKVLINFRRNSS